MTGFHRFPVTSAEFAHDEHLLVLTGRVLQYFRSGVPWQPQQAHVSQIEVYVSGPDRKGRTAFQLKLANLDFNALTIKLPPEQVDAMRRFVEAMKQARDELPIAGLEARPGD